jgi:hydrogenase/urease accessory protein HupE
MKAIFILIGLILTLLPRAAFAHCLDEYLQAATFRVEKERVVVRLRMTPGVAVFRALISEIDANADGVVTGEEGESYARKVRDDLFLSVDGRPLLIRLASWSFPGMAEMSQGTGEILLEFYADLPAGGPERCIIFENHHRPTVGAYLANCLVPSDPGISVHSQTRNYNQSHYELRYSVSGGASAASPSRSDSRLSSWLNDAEGWPLARAFFSQGVRHILTGYDHLLFIFALVLAATSVWDLVKIVTAFTAAHTITLTLAALNLVRLPSDLVEPLISASIIFVALQNLIRPGRAGEWSRLLPAFFFGLFHGLGFAGGLLETMHSLQGSTVLLAILSFSIGVEVGHQMVVLPLFASLQKIRAVGAGAPGRAPLALRIRRIGSGAISIAGLYYFCAALASHS